MIKKIDKKHKFAGYVWETFCTELEMIGERVEDTTWHLIVDCGKNDEYKS